MVLDVTPDPPSPTLQAMPVWDLTRIVPTGAAAIAGYRDLQVRADAFAQRYRGHLGELGAVEMRAALDELADISGARERLATYVDLRLSLDSSSTENRNLSSTINDLDPGVGNALVFFDIEWQQLPAATSSAMLAANDLAPYRHHLEKLTARTAHTLSEPEERVIAALNPVVSDWEKLFQQRIDGVTVEHDLGDGQGTRSLSLEEMLSVRYSADPAQRRSVEKLYARLAQEAPVLASTYDAIVGHRLRLDRLRRFSSPMQEANIDNDLSDGVVTNLIDAVEARAKLGQRWFTAKAAMQGVPRLSFYDQYAPLGATRSVTAAESRDLVLAATAEFSKEAAAILADAYNGRIDSQPRQGKRGGAFCAGVSRDTGPFVLLNFTGQLKNTLTEAHELGHLLHFTVAQRAQTPLTSDTGMAMAEVASTFNEMVTFDYLLRKERDPATRQALVAHRVEDSVATIFRQVMMARYEQRAYALKASGETLTDKALGDIWLEENRKQYGMSLELPESVRDGWSYVNHFIGSRFYTYSYAFAHLASLALYAKYRDEKSQGRADQFATRYIGMLAKGGAETPGSLLSGMGIDISDARWTDAGFGELERLVKMAESPVPGTQRLSR